MVAQTPFKPFVDSKVGVFATMHNPSIDFINLNYLEKAVAAQTLTATADESISQSNYDDYQKSEAIMSDNFNSTNAKWELSKSSIEGGWLTLDGQSHAIQYLPVDQQRNFEFETSLQYNKNDLFSSIFTISFGDYFVLPASYDKKNNGFSIWQENVSKPGKFKQLMDWRKFNFINSTFYLFTFRKIGPSAYFLINNELVATFLYKQQPSFKIAIGSRGQQQLMVDYVRLNYLVKEAAPVLNDKVLEVRTTEPSQLNTSIKPGGKYYGLIIGVSNYEDVRLSLDKPTKDATKLKEILTNNYSFTDSTTFLLLNPTRQKLMAELFRLRKVVGPNDNLLIFYAGHGYWDDDAKQGYWWAADAHTNDASFWLSNSDVREQIRSIKAGHTLLISDACFSGGIFKARGAASVKNASLDLQILYRMPSRRAITSGTMTTVPDQSVFFEFLSKRLLENQSPYLSSQQLFDSFRLAVINNSMTVPQDGVIAETGDEGGDFIFIRKN